MTDVGRAEIEVRGDVRNFARQTERDLDKALSKIKTPEIDIKADVDIDRGRAAAQFVKVGGEAAEAMSGAISKGLGGLASSLGSNPYVAAIGAALAAGIVATMLPAIGAALSGFLLAGAGLGVIGLGAVLLKEEPALQAAGKRLTGTLKKTFTDAAKPLLGPLVRALGIFEELIQRIGPQVSAMFATIADSGAIESLATGLAGLVEQALPGFLKLIEASGPFMVQLGQALPVIGVALSRFFSAIAEGGPGAAVFFKDLTAFVAGAIVVLGEVLGWLSRVYPAFRQFFIDAAAWIQGAIRWVREFGASVAAAFAPLVPIVTGVWQAISAVVTTSWKLIINAVTTGIKVIQGIVKTISAAISGDWRGTWDGIRAVVSTVLNGIRTAVSAALSGIRGVISGALATIRSLWSAGWNAMAAVVTGAASRVRSAVAGLRQTVIGAFAAAGSWLVSAGRRIIDGLIQGIRDGFARVRNTLSSLTNLLPDWKGPAEVDRRILERSGRLVMDGFERGLESRFASVRKTLAGLTGNLPTFTAPTGRPRGGDGAALAGGRPIVIENHIEIGGEVVRVVRTEINEHDRDLDRQVSAGTGGFRL